jgi:hypothetical protein
MDSSHAVLAFGCFNSEQRHALAIASTEASLTLAIADTPDAVTRRLREGTPRALLVDGDSEQAEQVVLDVRADAQRSALPILALRRQLGDLDFAAALAWSADDVTRIDATRSIVRRLRGLPLELTLPSSGRGHALVVDGDRRRRIAVGRALRGAGFEIVFAAGASDAAELAGRTDLALVVSSTELTPDQPAAIGAARAAGNSAAWIASAPPRSLRSVSSSLDGLTNVTAMDAFSSPDSVLFVANDLLYRRATDHRSSARLLYGTTVAFKGAGRAEEELGFSHNVSANGLYVRTLAAPEDDHVWLELTPPRSERRVRLVGKIAWRRRFGPGPNATVPPGFGVQIVDGARADLEAWRAGYDAFACAIG